MVSSSSYQPQQEPIQPGYPHPAHYAHPSSSPQPSQMPRQSHPLAHPLKPSHGYAPHYPDYESLPPQHAPFAAPPPPAAFAKHPANARTHSRSNSGAYPQYPPSQHPGYAPVMGHGPMPPRSPMMVPHTGELPLVDSEMVPPPRGAFPPPHHHARSYSQSMDEFSAPPQGDQGWAPPPPAPVFSPHPMAAAGDRHDRVERGDRGDRGGGQGPPYYGPESQLHHRPSHHPHPYHVPPPAMPRPSSPSLSTSSSSHRRTHSRNHSLQRSFQSPPPPSVVAPPPVAAPPRHGSPAGNGPVMRHPQEAYPEPLDRSARYPDRSPISTPTPTLVKVPTPAPIPSPVPAMAPMQPAVPGPAVQAMEEDEEDDGEIVPGKRKNGEERMDGHKCLDCGKTYKHPSCLAKHRWEHSIYWKPSTKFLFSKHQQVQMMEAASTLLGLDEKFEEKDPVVALFITQRGHLATTTSIASVSPRTSAKSLSASPPPRERSAAAAAAAVAAVASSAMAPPSTQSQSQIGSATTMPAPPTIPPVVKQETNVRALPRHSVASTTSTSSSMSSTPPSLAPDDESVVEPEEEPMGMHGSHGHDHGHGPHSHPHGLPGPPPHVQYEQSMPGPHDPGMMMPPMSPPKHPRSIAHVPPPPSRGPVHVQDGPMYPQEHGMYPGYPMGGAPPPHHVPPHQQPHPSAFPSHHQQQGPPPPPGPYPNYYYNQY